MKSGSDFKVRVLSAIVPLLCVCPAMTQGGSTVLLYDDFDDGNYDGWSVTNPGSGDPTTPPDVVPSPQGFSLRGVGSGYSHDPGLNVALTHLLSPVTVNELKIEMRAISGPQWPNSTNLTVYSGTVGRYGYSVRGESLQHVQLGIIIPPAEEYFTYSVNAGTWHDYAWSRDSSGWWSLSIDGSEVWHNAHQDNQLTYFDQVGLGLLRNQTEAEWVRISGTPIVPVPGGLVLAGIGMAVAGFLRRRRIL